MISRARRSFKTGSPREVPAVRGWIDLSASAQSGGEWTQWIDVLNNNPGAINAARRPAVGTSTNGLPIATFATNDAVAVPLVTAINNQTTKLGWAAWIRIGNLAGLGTFISVSSGTGGASAAKIQVFFNSNETLDIDAYISGSAGRRFTGSTPLTQNTWTWLRLRYNSALGGDANATMFVNGVVAAGTYGNLGAGGTLTTLPVVTGKLIIGNINDGTASAALNGDIGPDLFFLGEDITAAEELKLMNYRVPT